MQRSSGRWVWWLAGGCTLIIALIVVVVIAGAGFGAFSLYHRFLGGGFSCLPSDFPAYPGATYAGETYDLNGPSPGNACKMVYASNDSVGTVFDFYASRLNKGDWRVVSSDGTAGQIAFASPKKAATNGTVSITTRGSQSVITVQLYSR